MVNWIVTTKDQHKDDAISCNQFNFWCCHCIQKEKGWSSTSSPRLHMRGCIWFSLVTFSFINQPSHFSPTSFNTTMLDDGSFLMDRHTLSYSEESSSVTPNPQQSTSTELPLWSRPCLRSWKPIAQLIDVKHRRAPIAEGCDSEASLNHSSEMQADLHQGVCVWERETAGC